MSDKVLKRADGSTISYLHTHPNNPASKACVVYLHGLWSDKRATKAEHIAAFCEQNNIELIRFDAYAHGQSDGERQNFSLPRAVDDALQVIDQLTGSKPVIFIGSSMGGWVALKVMLERPERLAGIVGIAAAPDFTKNLVALTAAEREARGYPNSMIDTGHEAYVLDKNWNFVKPVHLVQGMQDESVPWQTAEQIASKFTQDNVDLTLIEEGDHRLNRPEDLDAQTNALMKIYNSIA